MEYAKLTERAELIDMLEKMRSGLKVEVPSGKDHEKEEPDSI